MKWPGTDARLEKMLSGLEERIEQIEEDLARGLRLELDNDNLASIDELEAASTRISDLEAKLAAVTLDVFQMKNREEKTSVNEKWNALSGEHHLQLIEALVRSFHEVENTGRGLGEYRQDVANLRERIYCLENPVEEPKPKRKAKKR